MSVDWRLVLRTIKELRQEVRSLRARFNDQDMEDETSVEEPELQIAPDNPLAGSGQYLVIVTSVNAGTSTIYGRRALPTTDASTFWAIDPDYTSLLTAKLPATVPAPEVGDTALLTFTGLTSNGPSYGLFGAGAGGGATQYRLKSVAADHLVCRTFSSSGVEGDSDVLVAKHWKGRYTPFHGVTSFGLTYAYSSNFVARTVTTTTGSAEIQVIIPAYRANVDVIYAITTQTCVSDGAGGTITLVDMNNDGRGWNTL